MKYLVRVWDLPTRLFHWLLALAVVVLVVTGSLGGNAMAWHFRAGYCVLALLVFRLFWGVVGGHWSRFWTFTYSPRTVLSYLKGTGSHLLSVGHNPMGAGSVFALLLMLSIQVGTGLFSDDEIAASGPLSRFVSASTVNLLTGYHKGLGRILILVLIALHIGAILFYLIRKKENLIKPMISGTKELVQDACSSTDTLGTRVLAACCLGLGGLAAYWIASFAS